MAAREIIHGSICVQNMDNTNKHKHIYEVEAHNKKTIKISCDEVAKANKISPTAILS